MTDDMETDRTPPAATEEDALMEKMRMKGHITGKQLWALIDLLNYALFIVGLSLTFYSRVLLAEQFEEVRV